MYMYTYMNPWSCTTRLIMVFFPFHPQKIQHAYRTIKCPTTIFWNLWRCININVYLWKYIWDWKIYRGEDSCDERIYWIFIEPFYSIFHILIFSIKSTVKIWFCRYTYSYDWPMWPFFITLKCRRKIRGIYMEKKKQQPLLRVTVIQSMNVFGRTIKAYFTNIFIILNQLLLCTAMGTVFFSLS